MNHLFLSSSPVYNYYHRVLSLASLVLLLLNHTLESTYQRHCTGIFAEDPEPNKSRMDQTHRYFCYLL